MTPTCAEPSTFEGARPVAPPAETTQRHVYLRCGGQWQGTAAVPSPCQGYVVAAAGRRLASRAPQQRLSVGRTDADVSRRCAVKAGEGT